MADQDGRYSEMITHLLRHVISSPHDADVKGDIFRHTIYPPSIGVIKSTWETEAPGHGFLLLYSRSYGGVGWGWRNPSTPIVEIGIRVDCAVWCHQQKIKMKFC